jgi:hypothetical protein
MPLARGKDELASPFRSRSARLSVSLTLLSACQRVRLQTLHANVRDACESFVPPKIYDQAVIKMLELNAQDEETSDADKVENSLALRFGQAVSIVVGKIRALDKLTRHAKEAQTSDMLSVSGRSWFSSYHPIMFSDDDEDM